jgi:hypothetical protein
MPPPTVQPGIAHGSAPHISLFAPATYATQPPWLLAPTDIQPTTAMPGVAHPWPVCRSDKTLGPHAPSMAAAWQQQQQPHNPGGSCTASAALSTAPLRPGNAQEIDNLRSRCADLEARLAAGAADYTRLRSEFELRLFQATNEVTAVRQTNAALETRFAACAVAAEKITAKKAKADQAAAERAAATAAEHTHLRAELAAAETSAANRLRTERQKTDALEARSADLVAQLGDASKQAARLEARLVQAQADCAFAERQRASALEKVEHADELLAEREGELKQARTCADALRT